ncbi:hypothetical protein H6G33_10235 [Calothrix sp. FACHB-1219]|uniref:hypothetical protein n=1 Tax=unclassified Calothrix TaxID=2619626 RepID=UPI00168534CF|nr:MULTISPECIES: hypothetical protein [unclassified Calothrix]MBD2201725.1 hypothetical protein [Calothrix sp. FACHB-168]MBD2217411.1 hypothetical protein [Calothrix sp. FACHB-1219]
MQTYNFLAGDTETGGLISYRDSLIEVAFIADNLQVLVPPEELEDYIVSLPKFQCYVVRERYIGEAKALAMNSKAFQRIADREPGYLYMTPNEVIPALNEFAYGLGMEFPFLAAGKNFSGFDRLFLEGIDSKEELRFHHRTIDPAMWYMEYEDKKPPSLETCLSRAGINKKVKHEALEDAADIIRLVKLYYWNKYSNSNYGQSI